MEQSLKIILGNIIIYQDLYFIHYKFGNPKERDTRLCLRFFLNNLVNPRIACK